MLDSLAATTFCYSKRELDRGFGGGTVEHARSSLNGCGSIWQLLPVQRRVVCCRDRIGCGKAATTKGIHQADSVGLSGLGGIKLVTGTW